MSKFEIYVDEKSDSHVNFRIFVNGALAGKLCLRVDEFADFRNLITPEAES